MSGGREAGASGLHGSKESPFLWGGGLCSTSRGTLGPSTSYGCVTSGSALSSRSLYFSIGKRPTMIPTLRSSPEPSASTYGRPSAWAQDNISMLNSFDVGEK